MATAGGPNIERDGLVFAIDSYSNIRGFTKFGTSGTNNSHRAIKDLVNRNNSYSLANTSQLSDNGSYYTLYGLTYPESSQTPASRHGITPGFNNTSATKTYDASRDLNYYVFDEDTNTWVTDSYFNGERISGHCYDTYDGQPAQHATFQADFDNIKATFPNATHIIIGSHASENIDNDADTVTRLKQIGLPDDAVGLGRVEFILVGKVNKPWTHHYVRENVSSAVAHMNLRLPLEGLGGALNFDGTDDSIDLGTEEPFTLANKTATWEAVVKFDSSNANGAVITRWENSVGQTWWFGRYNNNRIHLALILGGGYNALYSDSSMTDTTKYYHIAAVLNGTSVKFFLDGELNGTRSVNTNTWNTNPSGTHSTRIGAQNGGSASLHNGKINVVKLYDRALTDNEVQQNYNAYKNRFNI